MSYQDFAKVEYLGYSESVELMKNRQLDATLLSSGLGVAAVRDLATALKIVVIPIPADVVAKIGDAAYQSGHHPGQHLQRPDCRCQTVLVPNYLITHEGVSDRHGLQDDQVDGREPRQHGHRPRRRQGHQERSKMAVGSPVPLHPGAEKYYREAGLLK
jgi:uncharacterized protein